MQPVSNKSKKKTLANLMIFKKIEKLQFQGRKYALLSKVWLSQITNNLKKK